MSSVQFLHFDFSHATKLGTQLADLHLENKRLGEKLLKEAGTVGKRLCEPKGPLSGRGFRDGVMLLLMLMPKQLWSSQGCTFAMQ